MKVRLALLALLVCSVVVDAQVLGSLVGRITDAQGQSLMGANVKVTGGSLSEAVGQTTSADGSYRIEGLPLGTYRITVTHIGYQTQVQDVSITVLGAPSLDLQLAAEVIYLEQSVVSASRRAEKVLDAPASVAVVEGADIHDQPALNVAEHIRDVPAVDFAQTGLTQSNVVVRGFNNIFSGALLTLTDNRIARVPSLRLNAFNFIPVTSDDIERIEVVLGPGSALYGPNSSSGVMHIITSSPLPAPGTIVRAGLGERSVQRVSLRHAGAVDDRFGYKLSLERYTGHDWEYDDPSERSAREDRAQLIADGNSTDPPLKERDFDIKREMAALRLDYRASDDLNFVLAAGQSRADNLELTGIGAGQGVGWTSSYVQARAMYQDWFAQFYRNWSDAGDTFLLLNGKEIKDKSALNVFQLQHSAAVGSRFNFTYGFDMLQTRPDTEKSITGRNEDDDDLDEFGLYLQSETGLTEQVDLVLAMRYDTHSRLEDKQVSPRAALVFKPRADQTIRLTYNRAFSTPTSNNLYLDLEASADPFSMERSFAGALPFNPAIPLWSQGTYRSGYDTGFTFRRDATGQPMFRSTFQPLIDQQAAASGVSVKDNDGYMPLNHPLVTNVMWNVGSSATLSQLVPVFQGLATQGIAAQMEAGGMAKEDAIAAASEQASLLAAALPAVVPVQLEGLTNRLMMFDLDAGRAGEDNPFNQVSGVIDVERTQASVLRSYELGYKGIIQDRLVLAADVYQTTTEDFVGPLMVETPNVFLDPDTLAAVLAPVLGQSLGSADNVQVAEALLALDRLPADEIPGVEGNNNGSAVDELTQIFVLNAAGIPYGTVSPIEAYDRTAMLLTYRNFGEVTVRGLDLSLAYYPSSTLRLHGSYSMVDKDMFSNVGGIADVALNAPKHKAKLGLNWDLPQWRSRLGGQVRYQGAFPMNSGAYVGPVESRTLLDLSAVYRLPLQQDLSLSLNIDNALNKKYKAFIGAPEIGRLAYAQLGLSF